MKYPIIIYVTDCRDVNFYDSIDTAEWDMEPIDVEEGLFKVYDAEGYLLKLDIGSKTVTRKSFWRKLTYTKTYKNATLISYPSNAEMKAEEITEYTRSYLKGLENHKNFPNLKVNDDMKLADLIKIAYEQNLVQK